MAKKEKLKAKASKGLSPMLHKGLNDKRMASGSGNNMAVRYKTGETIEAQFAVDPDDFLEYDLHRFQSGKGKNAKWNYVPCAGEGCPLCDDEDPEVSKTTYRFAAPIWSFADKEMKVLEGPKTLAQQIGRKFKRAEKKKKGSFVKKTYDISKLDTVPVSYETEEGDSKPVDLKGKTLPDLTAFVTSQMTRYYGDDMTDTRKSSLDDEDAQDDTFSKKELKAMSPKKLAKAAAAVGVKVKKGAEDSEIIAAILEEQSGASSKPAKKSKKKSKK